jgi:hypothetical protein
LCPSTLPPPFMGTTNLSWNFVFPSNNRTRVDDFTSLKSDYGRAHHRPRSHPTLPPNISICLWTSPISVGTLFFPAIVGPMWMIFQVSKVATGACPAGDVCFHVFLDPFYLFTGIADLSRDSFFPNNSRTHMNDFPSFKSGYGRISCE